MQTNKTENEGLSIQIMNDIQKRSSALTLSPYELSSARAMTSYVAQNRNLNEAIVETMVGVKFSVRKIAELRHDDFRNVIAFLIDLHIGKEPN